jgi:hypothetical protein
MTPMAMLLHGAERLVRGLAAMWSFKWLRPLSRAMGTGTKLTEFLNRISRKQTVDVMLGR